MKHLFFRNHSGKAARLALLAVAGLAVLVHPALVSAATITYVQGNSATPQTPQSTVSVTFPSAQAAGDLNVIVVGWNDTTAVVNTIQDTAGNTYTLAVGPTLVSGALSQSIYYAKNIVAAGTNTVTVTFSAAAVYPDIRVVEYNGADAANPVDVTAAASGSSVTSSSGAATTINASDLLFGSNLVTSFTTGPGTGFTQRLLTSDSDIVEDQVVSTTGSYSATAPVNGGLWIMQMVAFRASGSGGTLPVLNLSTTSVNFGGQATGTSSAPVPVTVTNTGGALLTINSIAVLGGNTGDFTQNNNCGASLTPGNFCTMNITFTPTTTGSRSSTVTITDNAAGSPHAITISGTGGAAGSITITPSVSVLTFTGTQQFNANTGGVTWSVDGAVGGTTATGTITTAGLYTPPSTAGTHTVTASAASQSGSATVYISNYPGTLTVHNDNLRSGTNSNETVLTHANVNQTQFGKLLSYPVDGFSYSSPLYLANLNIPGKGYHNVVFVVTEHDSVYAYDADGLSGTALWHVSFLTGGATTIPCADTGECGDIPVEIGITSTPVIDPASGTIYVVAKTKEGSNYVARLHALDVTTGAEKLGGPVVIQGSVPGTADGTSTVTFNALRENQRTGLLLTNGVIYFGFGSHGDVPTYYGWVFGYNATTLQQVMIWNSTPNASEGGVFQSGGGLATDASGNIFFTTGNGIFDVNTGGVNYGDSILKLSPAGAVVDYFAPHDQANMSAQNLDLSSAGPTLLVDQPGPNPHVLITAGKSGTIYVVNRDNMGHFQSGSDNQIVQVLPGVLPNGNAEIGNFSSPVFFNNSVYFSAANDNLKAFQLSGGLLSTAATSQTAVTYSFRGGSFAASANGTSNGILWAIQDNTFNTPSNGVLRAYDAANLGTELYNSTQNLSRDGFDVANKFSIPLVANGKVFVVSQTQLLVYGLLGSVVPATTVTNVTSTTANGNYGPGTLIPIQVTFSGAVTVTGIPQLALNSGGTASYASGSGTNTLTFNYTVAAGQSSAKLDYTSTSALTLNGGTIVDGSSNAASLALAAPGAAGSLSANKNIVIGVVTTTVTGVTSTTANGTYGTGTVIPIQVTFSAVVTATGTPQLALNSGGTASYASGSGTATLTFNYTVAAGQNSAKLDYPSTSALTLNGGTIKDASSNNASLTLAAPGAAGSLSASKNIIISTSGSGTPGIVSLSPINSTGNATFTATVSDTGGNADIGLVYLLFNTSLTPHYGCLVAYDATNNFLLLYNDAGTALVSGTITPGTAGTLANTRCQISGTGASVVRSGNNLTVAVPVTFLGGFVGTNTQYLYAVTKENATAGYNVMGIWTGNADAAPTIATGQFAASGNPNTFNITYTDSTSGENIALAYAFFGENLVLNNSCVTAYSAGLNLIYLLNDAGTGLAGSITPGVAGTAANSQCTIASGGATNVTGANLTVPVNITAKANFGGLKNAWGYALNSVGTPTTGFPQIGTWQATPNVTPGTISMPTPTGSGNGPYTMQVTYSDGNGYLDLEDTTMLVSGNGSAVNGCEVVYAPAYNALFLLNDAGTGYVAGSVTPGVVGTPISNAHCALQSAGVATNNGTTTLTLPIQLTFTGFTGAKTVYGQAFDASGSISAFQAIGTLTLP